MGLAEALAPYLRRLSDPEPLVYTVPEAAKVLRMSPNTVRRLLEEAILPVVPHMGDRVLIPRTAVHRLVERAGPREAALDLREVRTGCRGPGVAAGR